MGKRRRDLLSEASNYIAKGDAAMAVDVPKITISEPAVSEETGQVVSFPIERKPIAKKSGNSGLETWLSEPVTISPHYLKNDSNCIQKELLHINPLITQQLTALSFTHWFPV